MMLATINRVFLIKLFLFLFWVRTSGVQGIKQGKGGKVALISIFFFFSKPCGLDWEIDFQNRSLGEIENWVDIERN